MALLGLAAAVLLAIVVFATGSRAPAPVPVSTPAAPSRIRVHVVGEVTLPGQYLLPAGSRLQDAIFAAHGPTLLADLNRVNLAVPLRDGDRVVVPRIIQPTYPFRLVQVTVTPGPRATTPPPLREEGAETPVVNVNTATAADLERLPGIGPVLARRIVAHREAKGLFRRLDDLLEVEGVGPRLLRRLEPMLRLDEGTYPASRP